MMMNSLVSHADNIDRLNKMRVPVTFTETPFGNLSQAKSEDISWLELTNKFPDGGDSHAVSDLANESEAAVDHIPTFPKSGFWSPSKYEMDSDGHFNLVGVSCVVLDVGGLTPDELDEIQSKQGALGDFAWYMHVLSSQSGRNADVRFIFPFFELTRPAEAYDASRFFASELAEYLAPLFRKVKPESFDLYRFLSWPTKSEEQQYPPIRNYGMPLFSDLLVDSTSWQET